MDERRVVEALRARGTGGVAEVYDRYAGGLYGYCWWLLRDHGTAREALHDTLLAAAVHADALRDPRRLRPWLYALVRAECLRRSPATPRAATGDPPGDAAELRSLARQAIEALPAPETEALELHVRHGIAREDLASICGMSVDEARTLLERAQNRVGQALRVQLVASTGAAHCAELARLLRQRGSGAGAEKSVERHARECPSCSERTPKRVSVSRLMGLLPTMTPPADLRQRVIDACAEPRLLEYRLLAARRLQPLGRDGFPRVRDRGGGATRGTAAAAVAGLVAASLCVAVGVAALRLVAFPPNSGASEATGRQVSHEGTGALTGEGSSPFPGDASVTARGQAGSEDPGWRRAQFPHMPTPGAAWPGLVRPREGHDGRDSGGGGSSQPQGGSTSPPPSPAQSGELRLSTRHLDLGRGHGDMVVLGARGGPLRWSASSGVSCLGVTPSDGTLREGRQQAVMIRLDRSGSGCTSGSGTITFTDAGPALRVSWSAPADPGDTTSPDPAPTTTGSEPAPSESGNGPRPSRSSTPAGK